MSTVAKSLPSSRNRISWLDAKMGAQSLNRIVQALDASPDVLRLTPHRRVLRIDADSTVIVKHFFPGAMSGVLKGIFRRDPALGEWAALRRAADHGLPVPTALAVGRRNGFLRRESFIVTEALNDAVPMGAYLYGSRRPVDGRRRKAIEQAARVLRKAHDAGMFQRDLHLDNLMVRNEETGPQVFLIDLQRVDFRRSLGIKERLVNLAELHGGCTAASHAERLRFLKTYLLELPGLGKDLRPILVRLQRLALKHRLGIWRSRQKRCLADNREFIKLRVGHYVGCARRDWGEGDFSAWLSDPSGLLSRAGIIKCSRTTTIAAATLLGREVHVKRYNYQGLGYALKDVFRAARARRAWVAGNSCLMRGVGVAAPIAYLERRRCRFLLESYLITETARGEKLSEILARYPRPFGEKRELIERLARYCERMHRRQLANRDLKSDNLIVARDATDSKVFFIVDFDGVEVGPVSARTRMRNLARLDRDFRQIAGTTRTDRLRFLRVYLGPSFKTRWKKYWRGVAGQADVD